MCNHQRQSAFTLLEILLSVLMLATAAVLISTVSKRCIESHIQGVQYENAYRLADQCLTRVEALGVGQLANQKVLQGTFPKHYPDYRCTITIDPADSTHLYRVNVTVEWPGPQSPIQIQLETLMYALTTAHEPSLDLAQKLFEEE